MQSSLSSCYSIIFSNKIVLFYTSPPKLFIRKHQNVWYFQLEEIFFINPRLGIKGPKMLFLALQPTLKMTSGSLSVYGAREISDPGGSCKL